jgi:kinetochore protein NDC80
VRFFQIEQGASLPSAANRASTGLLPRVSEREGTDTARVNCAVTRVCPGVAHHSKLTMSRRTTLGALSHNSLNGRATASRTSMGAAAKRSSLAGGGGSRLSLNPNASSKRSSMAPPTGRTSLAPRPSLAGGGRKSSTGVRRSSAFGTGSGKQDPRPVGDRSFQNACIRNLVEYLSDHGYDQPISAKILTRPSGRDFNNIMGFLFRQYDRMWQPTPGTRFEEAVIPFLKAAGYPFTLSKASLAAVGAPQTWPKVLAAISWMIELLAYDEEVRAFEADQSERRASGQALDGVADGALDDRAFFEYLGLAYRCFLDGDDDQYIALEEELSGTFEDQSAALAAHAQLLQTRNDELRAEIEAVRGRTKRLPELKQRRSDLKSDLVKFQQLVEQLNSHKASLESKVRGGETWQNGTRPLQPCLHLFTLLPLPLKVESRLAEEERLKREAASLRDQIAGLRDKIANQELSAEDVNRMGRERQRLREGMAAAVDAKAAAQKRCWEGEVQLSKSIEALEEAVHSYDAKARTLHLVPTDAKNANGMVSNAVVIAGSRLAHVFLLTLCRVPAYIFAGLWFECQQGSHRNGGWCGHSDQQCPSPHLSLPHGDKGGGCPAHACCTPAASGSPRR